MVGYYPHVPELLGVGVVVDDLKTWHGKPIESLTNKELIEALNFSANLINSLYARLERYK